MTGPRAIFVLMVCLLSPVTLLADQPVSFKHDVMPMLARECAVCHLKEDPIAGLILEPRFIYDMVVGIPSIDTPLNRIEPGAPDRSYLLLKMENRHLEAGGRGDRMPPGWLLLSPKDIDMVRQWIEDGARDN